MCGICMATFAQSAGEQAGSELLAVIGGEPEAPDLGAAPVAEAAAQDEARSGEAGGAEIAGGTGEMYFGDDDATGGVPGGVGWYPEDEPADAPVAGPISPGPTDPVGGASSDPLDALALDYTAPSRISVYLPEVDHRVFDGYSNPFRAEALSAYERQQVLSVLEGFEAVIDVEFDIVSNVAEADFAYFFTDDAFDNSGRNGYVLGYWAIGGGFVDVGARTVDLEGWTVMNTGTPFYSDASLAKGGLTYNTLIHELGHGLGMAHPHDAGSGSTVMNGVGDPFDTGDYGLNQNVWTVMSYNDGWAEHPSGGDTGPDFGTSASLMALDIAYLQSVYGANTATNGGNTTYTLDDTDGPGTWYEAIWDTGGIDTIKADIDAGPAYIDLRAATLDYSETGGGVVSHVDGVRGGVTIAAGVVIENAVGGDDDDFIRGNEVANEISGRGGDDVIYGYGGDDDLSGGTYRDDVYGGAGNDSIYGNGGGDTLLGEAGDDFIQGGGGHDDIRGGAGADRLLGSGGDDRVNGGAGDDRVTGGGGVNEFAFDADWGEDIVTDYEDGIDTIVFTAASGIGGVSDLRITENDAGHAVIRDASDGGNRIVVRNAGGEVDAADIVFEAAFASVSAFDDIA